MIFSTQLFLGMVDKGYLSVESKSVADVLVSGDDYFGNVMRVVTELRK